MRRRKFLKATLASPLLCTPAQSLIHPSAEKPSIINAGVGGNNTADLLARIEKDCLAHKPNLVILKAGTNDMNSQKHIPLPQYEKNLREIITRIKGINSNILLMTILPAHEPYLMTRHPRTFYEPEGHRVRKEQVNEVIKRLAAEYQLSLLDMHHVFETVGNVGEDADSLIQNEANSKKTDGIHPTPEGYRTMAVAIHQHLINNRIPHDRLVCFGDSITKGDGSLDGKSYPAYLKKLLRY
ncbi:SGNH/GDSL hydrolase family protein [Telluribacter sp. SYSU D00476]|uniref:SGNH/GDSL hydrolase family protein n=1 Tax=Telluribacter sp. SYSU D00476 TaxID=2811430 RepID=UPI001FF4BD57|nr:SGNH/GDSL hydrolase family protein [Telluribacter sp. SYSU D00476]